MPVKPPTICFCEICQSMIQDEKLEPIVCVVKLSADRIPQKCCHLIKRCILSIQKVQSLDTEMSLF